MKDTALRVAGGIFLIVAAMHLLRLLFKAQIMISGFHIRLLFSLIAFVVSLLLGIWMLVAANK